jgi:nitroreductase
MDYFDLIQQRRSIRGFQNRAVEAEKIHSILEAANLAPSAGNLQAYEIYTVTNASSCARLASALPQMEFFSDAPISLVFCANPERSSPRYGERGRKLYAVQDATIAATFAMLAVHAQGLGCVWVGAFDENIISVALNLPKTHLPVVILPIGYPAEIPDARPRRLLEEIVHNVQ